MENRLGFQQEKFLVTRRKTYGDKPWEERAIKVIRKAQVPVVPIYFHAKNSWLFYFLSKLAEPFIAAKYTQSFLARASCYIK
jgi:putative hemolysin